jgi:branched-subunit amino acid aminotransferase/4-amino-4-deoxychorismate lyase
MLDPHGFVATCNSTNFFVVRKGTVWAPTTKYQLHGITRANIIRMCKQQYIPVKEADFSLTQVYSADEAFVTGTFAGLIPVREVDGRVVGSGERGPLTQRLQQMYLELMEEDVAHGRAV